MRKNLLLLCLLVSTEMMADPVTPIEAQKKAQAFLWQKNPSHAHRAMRRAQALSQPSDEQAPLYIFNVGDDNGFVIVSGEDRTAEILGYSDSGHIDTEDMPEGLRELLDQYTNIIKRISQDNNFKTSTQQSLHRISGKAPIAPLLECQWNQSAPFNTQCPVLPDGNNCAVGCTAVAMAQVMYYHKWPAQTTHEIGAYTSSVFSFNVDLESVPAGVKIDWNNILPTYEKNTYNGTPSEDAVANLIKLCGRSIRMMYSTSSGAYLSDVLYALDSIFDYEEKTLKYVSRNNYSYDEWQELLYKELEEHRPILFQGYASDFGHAFVCDGYDSDDLFHINWGWAGISDGYFRLNVLDPDDEGTGGSLVSDGYRMLNKAIIGIQKNDDIDDTLPKTLYVQNITLRDKETLTYQRKEDGSFDPVHIMYNVINNAADCDFGVAVLITDMQGNIIRSIDDPLVQNHLFNNLGYWTSRYKKDGETTLDQSVPVTIGNDLADGDYKFVIGCRLTDTSEYLPCVDSDRNSLHFNISGNTLSIDPVPVIRIVGEPVIEGAPYKDSPMSISLQLRNDGAPFIGDLFCYINPVFDENHYIPDYEDCFQIEHIVLSNGESKTIQFSYTPDKSGIKNILLFWESINEDLIEIPIDINPIGILSLSNGTAENSNEELRVVVGSPFTMSLIAENTGDDVYHQTATVSLLYFDENNQSWYYSSDKNGTLHVSEEWEINLAPGEKETKSFTFDVSKMGQWYCLFVDYKQNDESAYFGSNPYCVCYPVQYFTIDYPGGVYNKEIRAYEVSGSTVTYKIEVANYSSVPYTETVPVTLHYFDYGVHEWLPVSEDIAPAYEWKIENLQPNTSITKEFSWENQEYGRYYGLNIVYTRDGGPHDFWTSDVYLKDPTGIAAIEEDLTKSTIIGEPGEASGVLYNLSGQRVSKGYKGLVVVKGKKYVIN